MKKKLKKYIKENLEVKKKRITFGRFLDRIFLIDAVCENDKDVKISKKIEKLENNEEDDIGSFELPAFIRNRNYDNVSEFVKQKEDYNDFQTLLFKMIDERNLMDSDVYNKVHIDRRLFSKIRNNKGYHPSKETVILLGLSLELNEEEIEELLDSASYSLPKNNYYDLIIRFCFINKIYDLKDVNDLLDEYKCNLFHY